MSVFGLISAWLGGFFCAIALISYCLHRADEWMGRIDE